MKIAARVLLILIAVALLGAGWVVVRFETHPSLDPYRSQFAAPALPKASTPRVTATFLGTSTILFSDGETALLTDGFFTRPGGWWRVIFDMAIEPDLPAIERQLRRANITKLAAVLVVHSHYDHSMDAPEVARRTGAVVVGSESTAMVARGWKLPERQIHVVRGDAPLRYGKFRVRFIRAKHVRLPDRFHKLLMGDITAPLVPPAKMSAWKEGGSYSIVIEHPLGTSVVHGSAGFVPGALKDVRADEIFLGIAGLADRSPAYFQRYYAETVLATRARRVIPIHWDDFTQPLDEPLEPLPIMTEKDGFERVMAFLGKQALAAGGPRVELPPTAQPIALYGAR